MKTIGIVTKILDIQKKKSYSNENNNNIDEFSREESTDNNDLKKKNEYDLSFPPIKSCSRFDKSFFKDKWHNTNNSV